MSLFVLVSAENNPRCKDTLCQTFPRSIRLFVLQCCQEVVVLLGFLEGEWHSLSELAQKEQPGSWSVDELSVSTQVQWNVQHSYCSSPYFSIFSMLFSLITVILH